MYDSCSSDVSEIMDYTEPDLDDLLDGDDDEADDVVRPSIVDVDSLKCSSTETESRIPLYFEEPLDSTDEETEDPAEVEAAKLAKRAEDIAKKKEKFSQMWVPPGIDLFPDRSDKEGFRFFSSETLSLEKDFSFNRRKLEIHGLSNIDNILTDRCEFLNHLFPQSQSVLISSEKDFRQIMDYLLYSISVCTDRLLSDFMEKALFDLRRNYGYSWSLKLSHLLTVLINYGGEKAVVMNDSFYNNHGLSTHLQEVSKSGKKVSSRYELPKMPKFIEDRPSEAGSCHAIAEKEFTCCLSKFISFICEFYCHFQPHVSFLRKDNDWCDQVVFLHLLLLLGTDRRLVQDSGVLTSISLAVGSGLDSWSPDCWAWGPAATPPTQHQHQLDLFSKTNVHKLLAEMMNEFFPGEQCRRVINWNEGGQIVTNTERTSDHHLNVLHRIDLVPSSLRGTQLRRYLAYLFLQTLASGKKVTYDLPSHVEVTNLTDLPSLSTQLSDPLRIIIREKNYPLMATIVNLYDIIVGTDSELDLSKDKSGAVELLERRLLNYISKNLPSAACNIENWSVEAVHLSELVNLVQDRWKNFRQNTGSM